MIEILTILCSLFVGYSIGGTREWHRVLAYLEANRGRPSWWLSLGIAADLHHHPERKGERP